MPATPSVRKENKQHAFLSELLPFYSLWIPGSRSPESSQNQLLNPGAVISPRKFFHENTRLELPWSFHGHEQPLLPPLFLVCAFDATRTLPAQDLCTCYTSKWKTLAPDVCVSISLLPCFMTLQMFVSTWQTTFLFIYLLCFSIH